MLPDHSGTLLKMSLLIRLTLSFQWKTGFPVRTKWFVYPVKRTAAKMVCISRIGLHWNAPPVVSMCFVIQDLTKNKKSSKSNRMRFLTVHKAKTAAAQCKEALTHRWFFLFNYWAKQKKKISNSPFTLVDVQREITLYSGCSEPSALPLPECCQQRL